MSVNMVFIIHWNVNGELHRPKNMTGGLNRCGGLPSGPGTVKAAFHSSPSLIRTLLYLAHKSILVKMVAFLNLSMRSEMSSRGYLSLIVFSFKVR